jgi:hypothetical protein
VKATVAKGQAEGLAHGPKRPPVRRACAEAIERRIMLLHRITLVVREAVAGMTRVEHPHHCVSLDFREDRSGCDAGGFGVAFYDCLLRDVDLLQPLGIDQQMLRRRRQTLYRTLHRPDARPIDVDRVDLLDLDELDTPTRGLFLDFRSQFLAGRRIDFFESSTPTIRVPGFRITAAAETGPASGLIPASSTPATAWHPLSQRDVSKRSILRRRCPSDRFSERRLSINATMARAPARASARKFRSTLASRGLPSTM